MNARKGQNDMKINQGQKQSEFQNTKFRIQTCEMKGPDGRKRKDMPLKEKTRKCFLIKGKDEITLLHCVHSSFHMIYP